MIIEQIGEPWVIDHDCYYYKSVEKARGLYELCFKDGRLTARGWPLYPIDPLVRWPPEFQVAAPNAIAEEYGLYSP